MGRGMSVDTLLTWVIALGSAVVAAVIVVVAAEIVARVLRRRWPVIWVPWRHLRRPLAATLLAAALLAAVNARVPAGSPGRGATRHLLEILVIAAAVWLIGTLVLALMRISSRRLIERKANDRNRRRARTQMRLIDRLVIVAFWVVGVALVLLTFPGVNRIGAGILASAGFLSIVAGLAAQSSLANLFAGIQLAFSDAIRLDDIVVVDNEYGHIEDITLTYVVVRIWDERRLVLPSTYFTTTPFTNWTRTGTDITGTVYFDVDWRVDVAGMRAELERILAESQLWDGRFGTLVVYDAVGSVLNIRALLSAPSADNLWGLRYEVREGLVRWVREHNPEGLPRQRVLLESGQPARTPER